MCYNEHNHKMWCLSGAEAAAISGVLTPRLGPSGAFR
jgi:hypothetical protein